MLTGNGRDYKDIPHITQGDEEFRKKFLSWELGDLSYIDVQEYLKEKDTILVPMASFEQHGQHLPILTDTASTSPQREPSGMENRCSPRARKIAFSRSLNLRPC